MEKKKLYCGELNLIVADFNSMSKEEFNNQLVNLNAINCELHITSASGKVSVITIGEILRHNIKPHDEWGHEIEDDTEVLV
jgi:hypothetical protein